MPSFYVYSGQDLGLAGSFFDPFAAYGNFSTIATATAPGTSAPSIMEISDDDTALNAEGAGANQVMVGDFVIDGTTFTGTGNTITVLGTTTIYNATTGETGTLAVIQINDADGIAGNNIIVGYASTIEINPGDSTTSGPWRNSGTTIDYDTLVGNASCFALGTQLATPAGWRAIETLAPGDLVSTTAGPRPILWASCRQVAGLSKMAPIRIRAGTLGAERDLFVSPDHRILLRGATAQLLFDRAEIWVAARDLVNDRSIQRVPQARIRYCHILLDGHFALNAQGCIAESLDATNIADPALRACIPQDLVGHGARLPTLDPLEARVASAYQGL